MLPMKMGAMQTRIDFFESALPVVPGPMGIAIGVQVAPNEATFANRLKLFHARHGPSCSLVATTS